MSELPVSRCSPFPPVGPDGQLTPFASEWRTETVLSLAAGIRAEKAFDRLPILADALEEAGCDDQVLLNHSRYCEQHSPTCWVIARVLPSDHLCWTSDLQERFATAVAHAARQGHPDDPKVIRGGGWTERLLEERDRLVVRFFWVCTAVVFGVFLVWCLCRCLWQ